VPHGEFRSFASVAWEKKGKVSRRERLLAHMDAVIPWSRLLSLIEPHDPKSGNGTQPKRMKHMEKRLLLKSDEIVDATIIAASPSLKNEEEARDPEIHQTCKGKDWHLA